MVVFAERGLPPLFTFDEEVKDGAFVFREWETEKPLALAIWSWSPTGAHCIPCLDGKVQNWDVILIDRPLLEEKKISFVFLTWALIKYSQLHFPNPEYFPYEKSIPTVTH